MTSSTVVSGSSHNPSEGVLTNRFFSRTRKFNRKVIKPEQLFLGRSLSGSSGICLASTLNGCSETMSLTDRLIHIFEHYDTNQWERDLISVCYSILREHRLTRILTTDTTGGEESGLLSSFKIVLNDLRKNKPEIDSLITSFTDKLDLDSHYHVAGQWVSEVNFFQASGPSAFEVRSFFKKVLSRLQENSGLIEFLEVLSKMKLLPWQIFICYFIVKSAKETSSGYKFFISFNLTGLISSHINAVVRNRVSKMALEITSEKQPSLSSLVIPNLGFLEGKIKAVEKKYHSGTTLHSALSMMAE
jgi:hypothetical protein